jgi:hypothetical protein
MKEDKSNSKKDKNPGGGAVKSGPAFYDIHCHAMNLSHPCMLAFVNRCVRALREITLKELMRSINSLTRIKIIKELFEMAGSYKEAKNLLAVMENDSGGVFLLMEDCLCGKYGFTPPLLKAETGLKIGETTYRKAVLTPLIMDFGGGGRPVKSETYYSSPARKPVTEQIIDLFNGINKYAAKSEISFFEIYPFLGINTRNFTLKKLESVLGQYFDGFSPSRAAMADAAGRFDGEVKKLGVNSFAGIKVYPPLGFDPWPEDEPREIEKVEMLYGVCEAGRVPITAHCNDEGYATCTAADAAKYTDPARWEKALKRYPRLKINLAHFGRKSEATFSEWSNKICSLIYKYENVYTDLSFNGFDPAYYAGLKTFLNKLPGKMTDIIPQRIMFGSDFMMSLLKIESYSKYLSYFSETPHLTAEAKNTFCSLNPERFLFGGRA